MSFRFNFANPDISDNTERDTCATASVDESCESGSALVVPVHQAMEVHLCEANLDLKDLKSCEYILADGTALRCIDCQAVEKHLSRDHLSAISEAVNAHSDLLPGIYEGGLKVWECSIDLTEHLSSLEIAFRGLTVLELGCGAGLPGIYALSKGARVYFQDYNKEVITHFTIPNCYLNMWDEGEIVKSQGRFYSGDWGSLCDLLLQDSVRFDLILTSETIYNTQNYGKLHNLFDKLLTQTGKIFVATKAVYFGVGGGVEEFKKFITTQNVFALESKVSHSEGIEREILILKRHVSRVSKHSEHVT